MSANLPVTARYSIRERGLGKPALRFAHSYWALQQRAQPIAQALELACRNGFTYLEAGLSEERMPSLRNLLRDLPLRLVAQGWAATAEEAQPFLERAAELNAVAINLHLGHAFLSTVEALRLLEDVSRRAEDICLPMLIETHRGRLSQDLFRFAQVVERVPQLALVLDLSHYIVAGEATGATSAEFKQRIAFLSQRTAVIHGRMSDGQSVQVRSADPLAAKDLTCSAWRDAMTSWLADAPSDAVFLFEPELGPPPYAQRSTNGSETFSRDAETVELCQLATALWIEAQEATASLAIDDSAQLRIKLQEQAV